MLKENKDKKLTIEINRAELGFISDEKSPIYSDTSSESETPSKPEPKVTSQSLKSGSSSSNSLQRASKKAKLGKKLQESSDLSKPSKVVDKNIPHKNQKLQKEEAKSLESS